MEKLCVFLGEQLELIMISTLLLLCFSFGTLQVVAGTEYFDSSNYKIINDASKCTGNLSFKFLCKVFCILSCMYRHLNITWILHTTKMIKKFIIFELCRLWWWLGTSYCEQLQWTCFSAQKFWSFLWMLSDWWFYK